MATEYAAPFAGSPIATSQQYRDRYRPGQQDMVDDVFGGTALAVANSGNIAVTIQNGRAIVQGALYELSAGPLSLPVAANGGGSNRFDIVCLTYDATHSPSVYARIVQGTAGAGLPALSNSFSGVWDFPIADYEKTPAGTIINLRDRRKFSDASGGIVMADPASSALYPPNARIGQEVKLWPSGGLAVHTGSAWAVSNKIRSASPVEVEEFAQVNSSNTSFEAGSIPLSTTFTAPPSGSVYVTVYAQLECAAPSAAYCGFEIRLNNSSGTQIVAANANAAAAQQEDRFSGSSRRRLITGLIPFSQTYFIRTMIRTSNAANAAAFFSRALMVEPVV